MNEAISTPATEDFVPHKNAIVDREKWNKQMRMTRIILSIGFGFFTLLPLAALSTCINSPVAGVLSLMIALTVGMLINGYFERHTTDKAFQHQLKYGFKARHTPIDFEAINRNSMSSPACSWGYTNPASPNYSQNRYPRQR